MSKFFTGIAKYVDSHLRNSSGRDEESISLSEDTDDLLKESEENIYEDATDVLNESMKKISEEKSENGIRVRNGKIEIKKSGNIVPCRGIELYINGDKCRSQEIYFVDEKDKVEWNAIINNESLKEVSVSVSKDKMKAFVNILYISSNAVSLKDSDWSDTLYLQCKYEANSDILEKYSVYDIEELLEDKNVVEGIDKSKLKEICENGTGGQDVEVARGVMAIDDTPSRLKILFDIGEKNLKIDFDDEKIDYKNIYSIVNVNEGDILAEIIPYISGRNGYNVYGKEIKRKIARTLPVKVGGGCKIVNDKIIATQSGRPSSKNGVVSVNAVYKVKNVDIASGNIKFIGDVEVEQNICEGMTVNAGNAVLVNNGVDSAVISAGGEINIRGNIINSKVTTGQIDMDKKLYLDNLIKLRADIKSLIECAEDFINRVDVNMNFPEVVKMLIEKKFRSISNLVDNILDISLKIEISDSEIIKFLKNRFTGANISNIKDESKLTELLEILDNEIDFFENDMIIQSDINISYCQDSLIKSTGKIQITGKGTYVSDIIALNEVEFINKNAVARGGKISSMKSVALGIVGSPAGVKTVVEVPEDGVITAEVAYMNTQLLFGKKSKIIDSDCRMLKAYVDKYGDIEIEKLNL